MSKAEDSIEGGLCDISRLEFVASFMARRMPIADSCSPPGATDTLARMTLAAANAAWNAMVAEFSTGKGEG